MTPGRPRARVSAFTAVLLLAAAGSLSAQEWFDDYEAGVKALQQGKAARAIELLERAVQARPEPGNKVITYGTNRLNRYHPYLRLAEAHLLAGHVAEAREALRRSAEKDKEPPEERARLVARVETAERARVASTPPITVAAAPPVPTAAPPTLPQAVAPAAPPSTPAPSAVVPIPSALLSPPAPVAATTGTLDLRSEPPGATVLLDDRLLGLTPLRVDVPAGTHTVTLRKEGTADQSFPVTIIAGQTARESRPLIATAAPAASAAGGGAEAPDASAPEAQAVTEPPSLVVFSDPPGARVYLDDEPLGETDPATGRLLKTAIAPGPRRLRLAKNGRGETRREITVAASGPTEIRVELPAASTGVSPVMAALVATALVGGMLVSWQLWRRRRVVGARRGMPAGRSPATDRPLPTPRPRATGRSRTVSAPPTKAPAGSSFDPLTLGSAELELETRALPRTLGPGAGERFGEYTLGEQLGKGGMASVFRADRGGEHVALKRPLAAFLEDPEFLERFLREAEIGRTLHHPNIIRIFERGDVAGVPYFTMELVKGKTLHAHVREKGALPPREACRLVSQVAEALDYAHLKGVVHRDLKPSNIMVMPDGTAKVMDYGIARARRFDGLTVTGAFLGTPDYVAPETAEGHGTDARSDLYSLGVVFYEILTGRKPFVGDTPFATLRKHVSEPPTPPSVHMPATPKELETIVLRLLAKDPEDRYPSAEELLLELRAYLNRAA